MSSLWDVYNARRYAEVRDDTWGHLAPNPRRAYHGTVIFAHSAYGGEIVVVDAEFDGLPDSPWFAEDVHDFAYNQDTQRGTVYRFTGTYRRTKARGSEFTGTTEVVPA